MIPVFPEQVLDNSLHTAILAGLIVSWLLYETFGFTFAGFVVAGYLAALAVVAPPSLVVVLVEAVLTYGIVWGLGVGLSQAGVGSRVFGRERFLLFVLVALPVRYGVTGLAMPKLERHLLAGFAEPEDLGLGLFGVGMVLVPLAANTFWKTGLTRGLAQLSVTTTCTLLIVLGLMQITNFGFGDFAQAFDALAVSAWTSSQLVLVLVCTVFVAARANLRFGWDFGGILVPALLAVLVFTPAKFLTTVVEIAVLFVLYESLIRVRPFSDLDLSGPRRIVSIYVVAYAWKWAVALAVGAAGIGIGASDLFGFGYLLTSLVVARAHTHGRLLHTLAPLLGTTAAGVAVAVPVSWALSRLPGGTLAQPADEVPDRAEIAVPWLAARARPTGRDAARSTTGRLETLRTQGAPVTAGSRLCGLVEGDVIGVLACGGPGPVLVIPSPRGDPDAAWKVGAIAERADVAAVVVSARDPGRHPTLSADAQDAASDALDAAQRLSAGRPVLVVLHADDATTVAPRDPNDFPALQAALDLPALDLSTVGPPADALALWPVLGPHDAVLTLGVDVVAGAPAFERRSLAEAVVHVPDPAPEGLPPDLVVPAAVRLAAGAGDGTPPAALAHLARVGGLEVVLGEDADGSVHWVLSRHGGTVEGVDRWLVHPSGGAWTVLVPEAWRRRGLGALGLHHHLSLDARVTWLGGAVVRARSRRTGPQERDVADRLARALLIDQVDGGRTLLTEIAPGGAGAVRLSHGNELAFRDVMAGIRPEVTSALGPWPGARSVDPDGPEASWDSALAYVITWHQAVAPDDLLVAWYPDDLLREPSSAPEHAGRVDWYRSQGVTVATVPDPATVLGPLRLGDPVRAPEVEARLQAHVEAPSTGTLDALRAAEGWRIGVWDAGLRIVAVARRDDTVCTRVAGADGVVRYPWNGCWRRP